MPLSPHASPVLSRRSLLRSGGLLALAGAVPVPLLGGRRRELWSAGLDPGGTSGPFSQPLTFPPEVTDPDIEFPARVADVPVLPGPSTRMWTFDGIFPGPLIRRPSGEPTRLHIRHELPPDIGSLTIHHHGNHSAPYHDGQPYRGVIEPGARRTYHYPFMEDGAPERATMQWYHDHTHFRAGLRTWMGLAGMVLLEDEFERGLPLPRGEYELPLLIADRRFDQDNQLVQPFTAPQREDTPPYQALGQPGYPPADEVVGDRFLVNGLPEPYHEVAARRYRLRILNASNFRPYNLHFDNDMEVLQIGTDSGLLPAPVPRRSILIGPAERADLVVDFAGMVGAHVVLESVPVTGYHPLPATAPAVTPLVQFRVTHDEPDDSSVPTTLRPLPHWVEDLEQVPDRIWAFGLATDTAGRPAWTINGRVFDHDRVDARPELNSTETWMLVNTTSLGISHYIHVHDVDWKVLSRNGEAPPPGEDGLKETFRLDPGEVVVIGSKFTDHLGNYMIHCHMLEHEDHGMMANFEVVPPGEGDAPSAPGPGVDALSADLPAMSALTGDEAEVVRAVLAAAHQRPGRPAPLEVIRSHRPPLGTPTGQPTSVRYICDL